jgi:hypothetical protein
MNIIIEVFESNYFNIMNIVMKIVEFNNPNIPLNLNNINNCLLGEKRYSFIKFNKIHGTDILVFKYRNRKGDLMILNKNIIITLYPYEK